MMMSQHRALAHLSRLSALFPKVHRRYEELRACRGKDLPEWPTWCYCPLAGAYAIVSGGGDNRISLDRMPLVAELGALAAWRPGKGIYRFDPDLARALLDTPLDGELPRDVMLRLPEWCVYVETTGLFDDLSGFFAHLEHDVGDGHTELRLLLDTGPEDAPSLIPVVLHLIAGGLVASVQAFVDEAASQAALLYGGAAAVPREHVRGIASMARPIVSLLLYLCSDEPDYAGDERPSIPRPKRTGKGVRTPSADAPSVWNVGLRIGAALRSAPETSHDDEGGSHASPRPHVRRAHWATYWTGPKTAPQTPRLRWLSPIIVGAGESVGTVRGVK